MGNRGSPLWPIRSIIGVLLIAPTPGSGYSFVQALFIWLAIQVGNIANQPLELINTRTEQGVSIHESIQLDPAQRIRLQAQGKL